MRSWTDVLGPDGDVTAQVVVEAGVTDLAPHYAAGLLTPVEALAAYRVRIARHDERLGAFVDLAPNDEVIEAAAASTRRWQGGLQRGALDGVPVAVKANVAVRGLPWHGGIAAYRDRIAAEDAEAVARLRAAGALILGTLNMEEGALGAKTDNPWFGPTWNPWKAGYTAGGSSGGSGAAVAAGLCAAALGTDTMGSVRIPASYCGVVGFKPPRGTVPTGGVVPLSRTLDAVGPIARSVADAQAVHEALSGTPVAPADPETLGLVTWDEGVRVRRDVELLCDDALMALDGAGYELRDVALPPACFGPLRRAGLLVAEAEGFEAHREALASRPDGFSPRLTALLRYGEAATSERLEAAYAALAAAEGSVEAWRGCEVLVLPTTPGPAFPMRQEQDDQADLTAYANAAGLAAISLPMGRTKRLPAGLQLIGRDAAAVFAVASVYGGLQRAEPPRRYA